MASGSSPRLIWLGAGAPARLAGPQPGQSQRSSAARIRDFAGLERSQLGALELLRDEVPPASIPGIEARAQACSAWTARGPSPPQRTSQPSIATGARPTARRRSPSLTRAGVGPSTKCSCRATISPSPGLPPGRRGPRAELPARPSAPRSATVARSAFLPPAWRSGLESPSSEVTVLARRFATRLSATRRPARAGAAAPQAGDEPARPSRGSS